MRNSQAAPELPNDRAAEEAAVLILLLCPSSERPIGFAESLQGSDFFEKRLGEIWDVLTAAIGRGLDPSDKAMGSEVLRLIRESSRQAFDLVNEVLNKSDGFVSVANAKYYAAKVKEMAARREAIFRADEFKRIASEGGERDALMEVAEKLAQSIEVKAGAEELKTFAELAILEAADIEKGPRPLLSTGLDELDKELGGGFWRGEFVVIGGIESHGKTATALHLIDQWTANGDAGIFISIDMEATVVGRRILQRSTDVEPDDWTAYQQVVIDDAFRYASSRAKCFIVDNISNIRDISVCVRRHVKEHNCRFVFIDYIQTVDAPGRTSTDRIAMASRALRDLRKELGFTLVILSQVNKDMKNRKVFWPRNEDLSDSAQMRRDADVILFPVLPFKINKERDRNDMEIYVTKNRNRGTKGELVALRFDGARQRILPSLTQQAKEVHGIVDTEKDF